MRRKHAEVTDPEEIRSILDSATVGRIATNGSDGYPYVTPVNYVQLRGKIYFHCAPAGEKIDNLVRDPRVCFEVDIPLSYIDAGFDPKKGSCAVHQFYHSVVIRGPARVVSDESLKIDALNALVEKHENRPDYEPIGPETPALNKCEVVEITPVSITGKSDLGQNRSPEHRQALACYLKARNRPGDVETVSAMGFDPAEL